MTNSIEIQQCNVTGMAHLRAHVPVHAGFDRCLVVFLKQGTMFVKRSIKQ